MPYILENKQLLYQNIAAHVENFRQIYAMNKKLWSLKVQKMGQILCVKKEPFRKSGHILILNIA